MDVVEFIRIGEPQGQPRPRLIDPKSGRAFLAKSSEQKSLEADYAALYKQAAPGRPMFENGHVTVAIEAFFSVRASWPLWKKEAAQQTVIQPTCKPDSDNISKAVLDGLNKVCFDDDKCCVTLMVRKMFSDEPRTRVVVAFYPEPQTKREWDAWGT